MYGWCLVSLFECHWHPHPQKNYRAKTLNGRIVAIEESLHWWLCPEGPRASGGDSHLVELKHLLNGEDSKLT